MAVVSWFTGCTDAFAGGKLFSCGDGVKHTYISFLLSPSSQAKGGKPLQIALSLFNAYVIYL